MVDRARWEDACPSDRTFGAYTSDVFLIALAGLVLIIVGIWIVIVRGLNRGEGWQRGSRASGQSRLKSPTLGPSNEFEHVKDADVARTWDPEL